MVVRRGRVKYFGGCINYGHFRGNTEKRDGEGGLYYGKGGRGARGGRGGFTEELNFGNIENLGDRGGRGERGGWYHHRLLFIIGFVPGEGRGWRGRRKECGVEEGGGYHHRL